MENRFVYLKPVKNSNGFTELRDQLNAVRTDIYVREDMIDLALANDQCLKYDNETGRCMRKPLSEFSDANFTASEPEIKASEMIDADPVLNFIHNESINLRPKTLVMPDLKWKYLVRSAMRGKNIMMTGAAGCGKTMAAKKLVEALDRPHFYFNLGATQDPRGTLIGNTHFKKDEGTTFSESLFVKAIQTKDAIILLDEISRAHPEAWNILMTVLDQGQRYLRLDEHENAPTIDVAEGVTFVATANIGNEYTATRAMDRALVDRFIIVEMDTLDKDQEAALLKDLHPGVTQEQVEAIAEIASMTRKEVKNDAPRLSNAISTRISVELAGLLEDGFTLSESAEVCIYPFFDEDGGVDSERTFMKQVVQKFVGSTASEDQFNTEGVEIEDNTDIL
jgi:MoxR-like ATPase